MEKRGTKKWIHFSSGHLAFSGKDYHILCRHIIHTGACRSYLRTMQVFDLQKYRIINKPDKIYELLQSRPEERIFRFFTYLN